MSATEEQPKANQVVWEGNEKVAKTPCMQWWKSTMCCMGDEYTITEKRLVILNSDGCWCFQNEKEDNTLRDNICDVDVETEGPGCLAFCGGSKIDTVVVKTNAGSGKETKIMHLTHGQGKVVKQILLRE